MRWPRSIVQFEFSVSSVGYLSLTHSLLGNLCEYYHKSCVAEKQILGYIFVADSMDLASIRSWLRKLSLWVKLCKIMEITLFKVIQRHIFRYESKASI